VEHVYSQNADTAIQEKQDKYYYYYYYYYYENRVKSTQLKHTKYTKYKHNVRQSRQAWESVQRTTTDILQIASHDWRRQLLIAATMP